MTKGVPFFQGAAENSKMPYSNMSGRWEETMAISMDSPWILITDSVEWDWGQAAIVNVLIIVNKAGFSKSSQKNLPKERGRSVFLYGFCWNASCETNKNDEHF